MLTLQEKLLISLAFGSGLGITIFVIMTALRAIHKVVLVAAFTTIAGAAMWLTAFECQRPTSLLHKPSEIQLTSEEANKMFIKATLDDFKMRVDAWENAPSCRVLNKLWIPGVILNIAGLIWLSFLWAEWSSSSGIFAEKKK